MTFGIGRRRLLHFSSGRSRPPTSTTAFLSVNCNLHFSSRPKGKGPIRIRFGEYHFLDSRPIYYYRIGCTRKSIRQIEDYANKSCFNGTSYNFLFHNCQDFVEACIKFFEIETAVAEPGKFSGRQTSGEKMFDAIASHDPSNISLN